MVILIVVGYTTFTAVLWGMLPARITTSMGLVVCYFAVALALGCLVAVIVWLVAGIVSIGMSAVGIA